MKKNGNIVAIACFLIILFVVGLSYWNIKSTTPAENGTGGSTTSTESQEVEQALNEGESMWLLFQSTTCYPCIEMQQVMDQLESEYEGKIHFIPIDVNDKNNLELLQEWQIRYIPTTFIVDSVGEITYQNVGVIPVEDLKAELNKVVK